MYNNGNNMNRNNRNTPNHGNNSCTNQASNNLNERAMNELVGKASQKIGTSPAELKRQIESGKLDSIMNSLPPQQAKNFQNILNNPDLAKKLMETPQAQNLMRQFFNSK